MKKVRKYKVASQKPVVRNSKFCDCGQERGARFGKDNNQCGRCWKPLD